jgi:hypothetical protein
MHEAYRLHFGIAVLAVRGGEWTLRVRRISCSDSEQLRCLSLQDQIFELRVTT